MCSASRVQREFPVVGRDGELLVPVLEEVLPDIEVRRTVQGGPSRAVRPVGGKRNLDLGPDRPGRRLESQLARVGLGRDEAMPEAQAHPVRALRSVEQRCVELRPADRIDRARAVGAIRPEAGCSRDRVDHPAVHGQRARQRLLAQPDLLQCGQPPSRDGQIDRPSTLHTGHARIGSPLVDVDRHAPASEQGGQQAAGQAGSDDRNPALSGHGCPRRSPTRSPPAGSRCTSNTSVPEPAGSRPAAGHRRSRRVPSAAKR